MSLGIKSTWRLGSRRIGSPGAPPVWPCGLRSRGPLPSSSFLPSRRQYEAEQEKGRATEAAILDSQALPTTPGTEQAVRARGEVARSKSNHARNAFMRGAFRHRSPRILAAVDKNQNSPYVPAAREYPAPAATKASRGHSHEVARTQAGFDIVWKHFGGKVPDWSETFSLLKRMTPKRSQAPNMAAVRVVLPSLWDMSVGNRRIEFLDATTGLTTKLRVSSDHQNPSAVILRGESAVLAKAVDELIRACPDVEIFKLGDVAVVDYKTKQLWPAIENAQDAGMSVPPGTKDNVWVHKELETYWIDHPYEQTPKPAWWSEESFEAYIAALVCGKLRPYLAMKYYKQLRENGKLIDTDGIRVRLILEAFEDASARECITASALKMAVGFMAHKGGHRASADRLFTLAEGWGLPMDAETFNLILGGYVSKRDVGFFHKFLQKMEARYFYPNARTWLHFLKLVQRDSERRQIIAAMYENGLFEDPATRRGIAETMAGNDSFAAFKAGKSLDVFLADQAARYGEDWYTAGAANSILEEFLRFHDPSHPDFSSFKSLLDRHTSDGRQVAIRSTSNLVIKSCISRKDWPTALWALSRMLQHGREPNTQTYNFLMSLAISSRAPFSLGVLFFYAVLDRKLRRRPRRIMQRVILKRLLGGFPVKIFSKKMGRLLTENRVANDRGVVAGAEWAILRSCDGYKPVKSLAAALDTTWRTMDQPLLYSALAADPEASSRIVLSHDYAVRMRDASGQRPRITVHLDAAFDPKRMLRQSEPRGESRRRPGSQNTGPRAKDEWHGGIRPAGNTELLKNRVQYTIECFESPHLGEAHAQRKLFM
ncbi:uncharacterized protein MAM_05561 [Metarhizium album ARSEF 1941]|uniref:Pentatricopeptide repeat domain-containing protein n=1 Tax=Metarhizium album (strain ARSEF 1941) TaxID=1081103 RepID=A0A0B2WRH1_METAS|nr:uncharacterized protein MAM_05561 [Metarhizium album ARSEF 1941]KHN96618.1 hypothetical protein MAM_05561 [Metarhizium album ARSEF 1941]